MNHCDTEKEGKGKKEAGGENDGMGAAALT
jgi:hypothetical protein